MQQSKMSVMLKIRQIETFLLIGIFVVFSVSCGWLKEDTDISEVDHVAVETAVESSKVREQGPAEVATVTQTTQIDPKQLLRKGEPEIPQLSLPEVENCPKGCCAMRILSQSDYPKTPIKFPKIVPDFKHDCAYCEKDVQRLGAGMVALLNGTPTFLCSTGCYSYLLSDPKSVLGQYREKYGYQ